MDRDQFRSVVSRFLIPMFAGSTVADGDPYQNKTTQLVAYMPGGRALRIRHDPSETRPLILSRAQRFDRQQDVQVVRNFVEVVRGLPVDPEEHFEDLLRASIRRIVARSLDPRRETLVVTILDEFANWSEQTYEGRRIAAGIGVIRTKKKGVALDRVTGNDFGRVISDGVSSIVVCSADSHVFNHEPLQSSSAKGVMAPLRYSPLALWTDEGKLAVALNHNGEILAFKNKQLVFARRRGEWYHFTHESVIRQMLAGGPGTPKLRQAVYETCLDVSFARTGGTVAIVYDKSLRKLPILLGRRGPSTGLIDLKDIAYTDGVLPKKQAGQQRINDKTQWVRQIASKPFHDLNRRIRQELVAIDGATILDRHGHVIAAGAIVRVRGGSTGGGRLASAKELSKFGLAIKVSADGGIRGFAKESGLFEVCHSEQPEST